MQRFAIIQTTEDKRLVVCCNQLFRRDSETWKLVPITDKNLSDKGLIYSHGETHHEPIEIIDIDDDRNVLIKKNSTLSRKRLVIPLRKSLQAHKDVSKNDAKKQDRATGKENVFSKRKVETGAKILARQKAQAYHQEIPQLPENSLQNPKKMSKSHARSCSGSRSRSRSGSPAQLRSGSRWRSRSKTPLRSRSKTPLRSRSGSRSRSRSESPAQLRSPSRSSLHSLQRTCSRSLSRSRRSSPIINAGDNSILKRLNNLNDQIGHWRQDVNSIRRRMVPRDELRNEIEDIMKNYNDGNNNQGENINECPFVINYETNLVQILSEVALTTDLYVRAVNAHTMRQRFIAILHYMCSEKERLKLLVREDKKNLIIK